MIKSFLNIILLQIPFLSSGQCDRVADSLALVALYNDTNGPEWTYSWNLNDPMSTWYGIVLNSDGCVKCVDLDGRVECGGYIFNNLGNNLIGQIPPLLGSLTELEFISLGNNFLTGHIPASLGQLHNLRELILRYNSLSGNIPTELGNLSNLENLNLTSNFLSGSIPEELGFLDRLRSLFLFTNDFTGEIPASFVNLQLSIFGAANNRLTGEIPAFLGDIILQRVELQNNEFVGCFPEELGAICDITVNFSENIALPWQGDFEQFCTGNDQVGAPCEDGLNYTDNFIDDHCVCVATITSLSESPDSVFKVFPNPVIDKLVILNKDFDNFVYTLYTIEGQKIDNFGMHEYNMSHLPSGIYLLASFSIEKSIQSWIKIVKL